MAVGIWHRLNHEAGYQVLSLIKLYTTVNFQIKS